MTPAEISGYIAAQRVRFTEVERRLGEPSIYQAPVECRRLNREYQQLSGLFRDCEQWTQTLAQIRDNQAMLASGEDAELAAMAGEELPGLEASAVELEKRVLTALLPPDPESGRDLIMEIKPAAGGEEAALFAGELYRAYLRYADLRGWSAETLELAESDLGGVRDAVFSLKGDGVWERMHYEGGVHRVQRVPVTESGGRIHTSTITVSIMTEADEVDLAIRPEDLRIDVFRSSGPGGQGVNTTDSAVRITHLPSGLVVASQQERSQHRNKDLAMRILRARLLERQREEEAAKSAAAKRSQVGSGERSERIRTYNFPQNRVTDHRFGVSIHNLPRILEGGFDLLLDEIVAAAAAQRLAELLAAKPA
jgi:peptide chain release factor 1